MILDKSNFLDVNIDGKIIIFPTDTVYGIGCKYQDIASVKRIYSIKKRDYSKPMAILCSSIEQVKGMVADSVRLDSSLTKYWPGKLTLIFKKNKNISDEITSGMDTVGVRIPNNDMALALLEKHGPMVVTSLNESFEPAIVKYRDSLKYELNVDYIVNGGDLNNRPSTVYDTINHRVLRQGDVVIGK
ncbi:MAG: L-threonylcarbamoyladenylate synthase [Tenericutes bacterium]|jgi:L-threonylcarbamoyladenylate synthase|nr:L-threonylcarbamoyladenylate synthase [Mycoplasmatota bacterium]